jgi:hypothetical protein
LGKKCDVGVVKVIGHDKAAILLFFDLDVAGDGKMTV